MVSLTDHQLEIVMDAAAIVAPERRAVFLERVGAMLKMRGRFSDADVHDVTALALCGLVHTVRPSFEIKYWPDQSR
jgi:methyl coenzyme M reductase subunit C